MPGILGKGVKHLGLTLRANWPDLNSSQVFCIQRDTTQLTTGEFRIQTGYGVTSSSPPKADPPCLLALNRNHWAIENRLHWIRD
jgi:hypothetical protein